MPTVLQKICKILVDARELKARSPEEAQPQALLDQKNREKGAESETRRKNRREQEKNGTTWHNSEETLFKRFKSSELSLPFTPPYTDWAISSGTLMDEHCKVRCHYTGTTYKCLPVAETFS